MHIIKMIKDAWLDEYQSVSHMKFVYIIDHIEIGISLLN
jgi:hypothetical protein